MLLFSAPQAARSQDDPPESGETPAESGETPAESGETPAESTEPQKVGLKKTEISAISASLLKFQKESRRAEINLEWDILPASDQFLEAAAMSPGGLQEFVLDNNDLLLDATGKPGWIAKVPSQVRPWLMEALYPGTRTDLNKFEQIESDKEFAEYWQKEAAAGAPPHQGKGFGFVSGNSGFLLSGTDYYSLIRDHYLLTAFLDGNGIGYIVKITGAQPAQKVPIVSNGEDVRWRIRMMKIPTLFRKRDTATGQVTETSLPAYRVAIKAELKRPISLTFRPDTQGKDAQMQVIIGFRRSGGEDALTIHRDFLLAGTPGPVTMLPVALPEDIDDKIAALDARGAENRLDTILQNVGGASLDAVITKGLLGGTQNSSIITGGLIGAGKVDKVFGVNIERRPTAKHSMGVLLGVVPSGDNSLFLGPSLRSSILTLGLGVRAYERDKGNGKASVRGKFAGVISLDMSRLTRSKVPATSFVLANTNAGGGWGQVTDEIAKNLAFVEWKLSAPGITAPPGDLNLEWRFTQIKDKSGAELEEGKQTVITFTVADFIDGLNRRQFIPAGTYRVTAPNDRYRIGSGLAGNMASSDIVINARGLQSLTYRLIAVP